MIFYKWTIKARIIYIFGLGSQDDRLPVEHYTLIFPTRTYCEVIDKYINNLINKYTDIQETERKFAMWRKNTSLIYENDI